MPPVETSNATCRWTQQDKDMKTLNDVVTFIVAQIDFNEVADVLALLAHVDLFPAYLRVKLDCERHN
jgi:hypothetical protein